MTSTPTAVTLCIPWLTIAHLRPLGNLTDVYSFGEWVVYYYYYTTNSAPRSAPTTTSSKMKPLTFIQSVQQSEH